MADQKLARQKPKFVDYSSNFIKAESLDRQMRREEREHMSWKDRLRKEREAYNA